MSGQMGNWNKDCKQREQRQLCHQSFWCGEHRTHAINLSPGGMCFRTPRRIEPGQVITLNQGPTLQIKVRIAWTRRLESCTEVGVQFQGSAEAKKAWLLFLKSGGVAKNACSKNEPLLALPAPGQTFVPPFATQLTPNMASPKVKSARMGQSWMAARRFKS